jgi:hypothetical protein
VATSSGKLRGAAPLHAGLGIARNADSVAVVDIATELDALAFCAPVSRPLSLRYSIRLKISKRSSVRDLNSCIDRIS